MSNGTKKDKKRKRDEPFIKNATDLMAKLQPAYDVPETPAPGKDLTKRLNKIRNLIEVVNQINEAVATNPPRPWGSYRDPTDGNIIPFTTRVAQPHIDDAISRLNRLKRDTKDRIRSNQSLISTTIAPKTGEFCGDGNCYIQFVNIGLGDCTTIATPQGRRIMIDMGSHSMTDVKLDWSSDPTTTVPDEDESVVSLLVDTIRRDIFLGMDNDIHILILTHTDGDHHNKLQKLGDEIKFTRIYHSDEIDHYGVTTLQFIKPKTPSSGIKRVDLKPQKASRDIIRTINGTPPPTLTKTPTPGDFYGEYIDSTTKAIVLYEETNGFKISILASNVSGVNFLPNGKKKTEWTVDDAKIKTDPREKRFKRNASYANKGSQVILVEFNGQKAIITGDATAVTEYFMATQDGYAPLLQDLDVYRLPHHGSSTSSSMRIIDKLTNVREVVGSCSGRYTKMHRLPLQGILNLYASPGLDSTHIIWAFDTEVGSGPKSQNKFEKKTYATGSNGTRIYKFAKP